MGETKHDKEDAEESEGEIERERVNLCHCLGEIIVESANSSLVYRQ